MNSVGWNERNMKIHVLLEFLDIHVKDQEIPETTMIRAWRS
jgi:hypothetical protein